MEELQWVDKYKPKTIIDIYGNQKSIEKISKWLDVFKNNKNIPINFKNAILISGPPGIGKTSISHILLKDKGFDPIEFNASELRTSKILVEKIENILSGRSIKTMFNKDIKTGIIMDEIDGIESRKECSASDIVDLIDNNNKKFKKKKKKKGVVINKNPIICICNNVNKSVNPLLSSVIHIEFNKPNDNDIYQLLSKINIDEKLNINPILLNLIIPYCQYDFRRTIYIMEFISSFVKNNKINNDSLIKLLDNIGNKDIDLPLFDAVDNVLNNSDLKYDELLHNFDSDQNFVPFIIHENFIDFIDKNTNNNYIEKLDLCLEYYENLTKSQIIKNSLFGKWYLTEYVGILSTYAPNIILRKAKIKEISVMKKYEKSAMISKYNYRYYNLKSINHLCKKLDIDINNFQIISIFAVYNVFVDRTYIDYIVKYFKKIGLTFKEFEKLMKLSSIFEEYTKKYTKKIQKEINTIYDSI
tara:strand:+ start:599 stop:2011 length:1413 start_codon:yes stop_codon:yes gene_type:complete